MRVARAVAATGALALTLAVAASAPASIDPQHGIAKIELGMTVAEVIERKGKPDADKVVPHEIIGKVRKLRYGQTKAFFAGTGEKADAISLRTESRGQRTDDNVGVGTPEDRLVKAIPRLRCRTECNFGHCFIGRFRPGKVVTDFVIKRRTERVKRVSVAIVID